MIKSSKEQHQDHSIVRHQEKKMTSKEDEDKLMLKREVGLIGGVGFIVGAMIGAGIFVSPKGIMRNSGSMGVGFMIWIGSGLLATCGALSYAEIGTLLPKSGGEVSYLLEAFGSVPAFLFAWTATVILRPASLGMLSLTFAQYTLAPLQAGTCTQIPEIAEKLVAAVLVMAVVLVNCFSVKLSTKFVTIFSFGKVISLTIIILAGIVMVAKGHTEHFHNAFEGETPGAREIALAFYQGLYAYDGWGHLNYITEELKNPFVNLPRAIVISMILVTGLYMLTNVAYFSAMSFRELLASPAVGVTFGERVLGVMQWVIPVAVAWSVAGTCLGSCFLSGRISFVAAREGQFPFVLAMLHVKRSTPVPSVLLNGFLSLLMLIPSDFDTLVDYFSFSILIFQGATCAGVIYFRFKLPDHPRPVKVPLIFPAILCVASVCLVLAPIIDKPEIQHLFAVLFILSGLIFYVPFVHFGLRCTAMRRLNNFLQKLLVVALPDLEVSEDVRKEPKS